MLYEQPKTNHATKNGTFCPLIKKDCIGLQCAWFTRVQGVDTNTGNQVDEFQCAIAWMPMLLIENSGQQRQTGAAVESFRNEMVRVKRNISKSIACVVVFSKSTTIMCHEIEPPKAKQL
jgi:hypothetical protein